jgi:hypothetical protein
MAPSDHSCGFAGCRVLIKGRGAKLALMTI